MIDENLEQKHKYIKCHTTSLENREYMYNEIYC